MALETGTYISDLVATNPTSGDNVSQGDDHLRLIKSTVLATFPSITGAVTPTHSQINQALATFVESTFTPTIVGTTTAGTGTYTTQLGRYMRVANIVYFSISIVWTAHTGTGNMRIEGLPVAAVAGYVQPASAVFSNVTLTAGSIGAAWVTPSSTQVNLVQVPTGGGGAASVPIDTAATVYVTGFYFV